MAVTRPISYKFISSHKTGKYLVATAWLVSFMICAPPLIVQLITADDETFTTLHALEIVNETHVQHTSNEHCACTPMNNNDAYIVYSAVGSFVFPLMLIVFLNWGIFVHGRMAGKIRLRHAGDESCSGRTKTSTDTALSE
jgi:hypothetical protein